MKVSLKYGLLCGVLTIAITLVMYFVNPVLLGQAIPSLCITYLLPIIFMVLACREHRKANEGFLDLGEGFRVAWTTLAVGLFIGSIFTLVLFNVVDPELKEKVKIEMEKMSDASSEFGYKLGSRAAGASEAETDISYELKKDEINERQSEVFGKIDPFGFGTIIIGWLINIFTIGLIISLIIAAVMKKNKVKT